MKILKIAIILLIPAMGIVSCQKSGVTPDCPNNGGKKSEQSSTVNGRSFEVPATTGDNGTTVVGSGDDDRDGGDRKKKTGR